VAGQDRGAGPPGRLLGQGRGQPGQQVIAVRREQLSGLRRAGRLDQVGVGQVGLQPQRVGAAPGGDDGPAGLVRVGQPLDPGPGVGQVAGGQFRVGGGEVHGRGPGRVRAEQGDVPLVGAGPVGDRTRRRVAHQFHGHLEAPGQFRGQGRGHPVGAAVRGSGADQNRVALVDAGPQPAVPGQVRPRLFTIVVTHRVKGAIVDTVPAPP
jgi:hypothetical protein